MKIAAVGKGGSGKTTVIGTLARVLAEDGIKVLAIDGDPNPNLAMTLGIAPDQAERIENIPASVMAVKEESDGTRRLRMTMSEDELMRRYGTPAPNDIDLIIMGKPADGSAGSGCMCASHRAVRGLISEMGGYGEHTITDMEAGLEHLKRGTARNVDTMLIIAEPYYRSLEAAARTWSLANELAIPNVYVVANKVRNSADQAAIEEFCVQHDMPIIGFVPSEEQFMEAERQAVAPIDFAPQCAGTAAIRDLARKLRELKAPAAVA
jgi:CO dehydrogenase maturation factor